MELNLSEKYLRKETFAAERKKLKDVKSVESLLMRKSVLVEPEDATTELHLFLNQFSGSLKALDFSNSNVSGRIFYKGRGKQVKDPVGDHVTVESKGSDGEAVVRDDDPELEFIEGDDVYHFVKTMYSPIDKTFSRYYVLLDWLKKCTSVNMSGTGISGYGLTALVAASANTLQSLSLRACANVDDRGLYAIARLCKSLVYLDVYMCEKLTQHGILYLSEMPAPQIKLLKEINITNPKFSPEFASSFFYALEDRGFQGSVVYFHPPSDIKCFKSNGTNPTRFQKYADHFNHIFDLQLDNITGETLKPYNGSTDSYELDLSKKLINDRILEILLRRWGSKLAALKLSETYITHNGLAHLQYCPNLYVLHLCKCPNIVYKSKANKAIMQPLNNMPHLQEIHFSETRLSGRMLSEHPSLKLTSLEADRCPISVHAMRMLAENCEHTLTNLSLAGCNFLNTKAMHYLNKFTALRTVNLAQCTGLTRDDFKQLTHSSSALKSLQSVEVSGIHGMDKAFCQKLANDLTEKCGGAPVSVVNYGAKEESISSDKNPYLPIPPSLGLDSDGKRKSGGGSPIPGLEPVSPPPFPRVPSIPAPGPLFSTPPVSPALGRIQSERTAQQPRLSGSGFDPGQGIYKPMPPSSIVQPPRNVRSKTMPAFPPDGSSDGYERDRSSPLPLSSNGPSGVPRKSSLPEVDHPLSYSPFLASDFGGSGSGGSSSSGLSKSSTFPVPRLSSSSSSSSSSSFATSSSSSRAFQNYLYMEPSEIEKGRDISEKL